MQGRKRGGEQGRREGRDKRGEMERKGKNKGERELIRGFHAGEQPIRHTAGGQTKPSPG